MEDVGVGFGDGSRLKRMITSLTGASNAEIKDVFEDPNSCDRSKYFGELSPPGSEWMRYRRSWIPICATGNTDELFGSGFV